MDDYKRALSLVMLTGGLIIFAMVIVWNVEVMASKTDSELRLLSSSLEWEDYLYRKNLNPDEISKK